MEKCLKIGQWSELGKRPIRRYSVSLHTVLKKWAVNEDYSVLVKAAHEGEPPDNIDDIVYKTIKVSKKSHVISSKNEFGSYKVHITWGEETGRGDVEEKHLVATLMWLKDNETYTPTMAARRIYRRSLAAMLRIYKQSLMQDVHKAFGDFGNVWTIKNLVKDKQRSRVINMRKT
jgi:hypothetical protein